ncbi:hypothetical protein BGZ61DRAFT_473214 [Ilyonectria robusta]|uniref:uncharacterized protein n=1 Tax=Ilyonectria robusta TaxID=1079257 RepID=UPI001E8D5D7D|nr:uncharacterized protein BGZ61DRAFT_473214 [Ilyonectria robusta]KAH8734482.1 hypothetical protein BGZ61DRAFT_473214 [Ilyonectria robusta]
MATELPAATDTAESSPTIRPRLTLWQIDREIDGVIGPDGWPAFIMLKLYSQLNAESQSIIAQELLLEHLGFRRLPVADRRLATHRRLDPPHSGDCDESSNSGEHGKAESAEIDIFADPCEVKKYFLKRWISVDRDTDNDAWHIRTNDFRDPSLYVEWDNYGLYTTPGTRGIGHNKNGVIPSGSKSYKPAELISSQLLLYRLTIVLNRPPLADNIQRDGIRSAWGYTLHWIPDVVRNQNGDKVMTSSFCIFERKGSVALTFIGSEEASKAALLFFKWLVSDNVPHPCGSIVAGNQFVGSCGVPY